MYKFVCKKCGRFFYMTTTRAVGTLCSCGNDSFKVTQENVLTKDGFNGTTKPLPENNS